MVLFSVALDTATRIIAWRAVPRGPRAWSPSGELRRGLRADRRDPVQIGCGLPPDRRRDPHTTDASRAGHRWRSRSQDNGAKGRNAADAATMAGEIRWNRTIQNRRTVRLARLARSALHAIRITGHSSSTSKKNRRPRSTRAAVQLQTDVRPAPRPLQVGAARVYPEPTPRDRPAQPGRPAGDGGPDKVRASTAAKA